MYGSTSYGGAPLGEALNGDSQTRTSRGHTAAAIDGTARAARSYRLPLPDYWRVGWLLGDAYDRRFR